MVMDVGISGGGTHDPSIMDKWVSPRLLDKIATMESVLAHLQNPVMSIPLENLDIQPETLAVLKTNPALHFAGHLLAISDLRNITQQERNDIQLALFKYTTNMGQFGDLILDHTEEFYLIRRWSNESNPEKFQSELAQSISYAQKSLQKLQSERHQEIDALHIVTIELPDTLRLLNDSRAIIDTAEMVLRAEFSKAVQDASQNNVDRDVAEMNNPTTASTVELTWLDRLLYRVATCLNSDTETETAPEPEVVEPAPSHDVETFTLQFGVSAKLHAGSSVYEEDVAIRKKLLMPIFAEVADDLSGTVLTRLICERLAPNQIEEPAELDVYDWIQTQTPHIR